MPNRTGLERGKTNGWSGERPRVREENGRALLTLERRREAGGATCEQPRPLNPGATLPLWTRDDREDTEAITGPDARVLVEAIPSKQIGDGDVVAAGGSLGGVPRPHGRADAGPRPAQPRRRARGGRGGAPRPGDR